jgi:hypothetical protein
MIQKFTLLILCVLGFTGLSNLVQTKSIQAMENIDSPIVLEMFTSQSCSSCPPADKVLSQLEAQSDNIIALSCHVTYWNHLHWEDTLSKEFCSTRQRDYVRALRSRGPYTPQIMINGKQTMVGSQGAKIVRAIENAAPIKSIDLSLDGDILDIKLPETPGNDSYALNLVIYKDAHKQSIPSGENRGRTVRYTNPVERIVSLGTWDGTGKAMDHDISSYGNVKGYALLAQKNGKVGEIIAAGKVSN